MNDVFVKNTDIVAYGRNVSVNTINRDSSCSEWGRYAETIVFDNTTKPYRKILEMGETPEGCLFTHDKLVDKWSKEIIAEAEE